MHANAAVRNHRIVYKYLLRYHSFRTRQLDKKTLIIPLFESV